MNFLKKVHKLVGKNEQFVKKPQKHDTNLQNNSTLYFQVGLILTLLVSYGLFEMNFKRESFIFYPPEYDDTEEVYSINIVPEVIPEPVTETKVEPTRKKLLAINIIPVENNTVIPKKVKTEVNNKPSVIIPKKKKVITKSSVPRNTLNVEQMPVYPGCEKLSTNVELRQCMSKKISRLIQRKFNTDLASILGLTGKQHIYVQFKIDKSGNVSEVNAKAKHIKLKKEAIRVVDKIPQMIPGKHSGENVEVVYSLPIVFQVQD